MSQEIPLYSDDFCELDLTDVFGAESDSDVPSDTSQNSQEIPLYTGDTLEKNQQSISHHRCSDSNDTLQDNEKNNSQSGSNDSNDNSNLDINPQTPKGEVISRYLQGQFSDSSSSSKNGESDDEDEDPDDSDFIDYEGRGSKFLDDNRKRTVIYSPPIYTR